MLFSSITFLFYFLPVVLILYFAVPKSWKNAVLLATSLVFYAWGEPKYVLLMAVSIGLAYILGILIEKNAGTPKAKLYFIIANVVLLGFLGFFKYADFFVENFNALTTLSVPLPRIALPIGISFYTFQVVSYIIDVYRGNVKAQKNFVALAAYVTMFPQLIAGPIVRYSDIAIQLETRTHSFSKAALGVRRFTCGLAKKILIANALGELCDTFKASDEKSVMFYWLYAIAFMIHVYFDFSGYSDMAIGLGHIFGFDFLENFNYPFISSSVTEFWRRWHMSLGTWFRDYVYIPLGGNRVPVGRQIFNIFVVWMLTGFWHGAAWNFVVWGLFFAVLLLVEKFFILKYLKKYKVIGHIYVLIMCAISFVIFNASNMKEAFEYIGGMFGAGGIPFVSDQWLYELRSYAVVLIIGIIGSTPIIKKAFDKANENEKLKKVISIAEPLVICLLLVVMTAYLVDGSFNPFLYFRF